MSTASSSNNFGYFTGLGRLIWREVASGKATQSALPTIHTGPSGSRFSYPTDEDGAIVQNGGIQSPQEIKMKPNYYYRFFSAGARSQYGDGAFASGMWWIDMDNFAKVVGWANEHDISISKAAQHLLAVPKEWSDCAYVGRALLDRQLKAWVGIGKPASGGASPFASHPDGSRDPIVQAPAHLELKQYCVPGTRELLQRCFKADPPVNVLKKQINFPIF